MRAIAKRLIAGLPATTKSTRLIFGGNSLAVSIFEFNLPVDQVWTVLQSLDYSIRYNKFLLSFLVIESFYLLFDVLVSTHAANE